MRKFNELISKSKVTQRATNITDKKEWVINVSFRQLTQIKTDLAKDLDFSITSKKVDTIHAKLSLTLQKSKPSKDNLSKNERKTLKELKSDTSIVVLPAEKGRSPLLSLTVMTTSKMYGSCKQWSISIT